MSQMRAVSLIKSKNVVRQHVLWDRESHLLRVLWRPYCMRRRQWLKIIWCLVLLRR